MTHLQPIIYIEQERSTSDFVLEDGTGKILNEASGWNLPGGPGHVWIEFADPSGTWNENSTGAVSWNLRPDLSDIWTEFPDPSGDWDIT